MHPPMDPTVSFARTTDNVSIAWLSVGGVTAPTGAAAPVLIHMPGSPFSNFEAEWRIAASRRAYETLSREVRLIQYDARGTGRSQRDVTDLGLEAMIRDLDAVVEAADLDRFALLGFYHSATSAIAYAARHPQRVTSLILFGGSTRGWNPMSGASTQALLSLIDRDWDTFTQAIAHSWLGWSGHSEGQILAEWFRTATTPAIARATLQAASGIDVTREAGQVRCPALVLHRRDATVIPLEVSEELAAALPSGELRILEGSSATLFYEHMDVVIDEIVGFLRGGGVSRRARSTPAPSTRADAPNGLSPRELEVLRLLAQGETNGQIAARLGISINTVERHVGNLYRKSDARGRAEASAFAVRHGLD
jgi:pimeloyl-ACP methyl ester carboxylesterase/DNA-binding CsgD family transcriptional regulator